LIFRKLDRIFESELFHGFASKVGMALGSGQYRER